MIKLISIAYKKPGMSDADFDKYWKEEHGPLFAKYLAKFGVRKYAQNHLVRLPGVKYEGDGIAELWFDDLASQKALDAWLKTAAAREIAEDGAKFLEPGKGQVYIANEFIIKDFASSGSAKKPKTKSWQAETNSQGKIELRAGLKIKEMVFCHKKPGLSYAEFSQHWKEVHGPLFAKYVPAVKKYVQNHFIQNPGAEYDADGMVEMYWDDFETQKKYGVWSNSRLATELAEDSPKFLDIGRQESIWVVEEEVIWEG
jgi:uncharacterized protein (TIGR02118 family)